MTVIDWLEQEFRKLAFDEDHHLGLGDIRITQGMLDELFHQAKEMEKNPLEFQIKTKGNSYLLLQDGCTETLIKKLRKE